MKSILSILFLAVTVILFFIIVKPLYGDVKQLKSDVSSYASALDNSNELKDMRDELIDKYKNIKKEDKDRLEHFLPSTIGNIELILEIEKIANLNGMPVKTIKFDPPKEENGDNSQDQIIDESDPSQYLPYGIFPMEFVIEGSYDNFLSFLNDLEHNLRLVDIKSISFNIPDNSKKDLVNPNIYSYTLKIETYWLK